MFRGLKTFKKDLESEKDKIYDAGVKATREVAEDWFTNVVSLTPVDTGFASSKWDYSIGSKPPTTKINNPRGGKYSPAPTPSFMSLSMGTVLYLYNNVAYFQLLEKGWSDQAPANFFHNSTRRHDRKLQSRFDAI